MPTDVKLPRLGQGMESGTIVKWLKAEGDAVEKGEPLYEVDTDKATQEVEAEASGVLLRIAVASGEVPVGETIALIGQEGERLAISSDLSEMAGEARNVSEPKPEAAAGVELERAAEPAPEPVAENETETPFRAAINGARKRTKASPLARRMAEERGVDLGELTGTGPEGRIVAEDVERAAAAAPAAAPPPPAAPATVSGETEQIPLTRIRRAIARRLTAAWTVPVFALTVSIEMTRANDLLARTRALDPDVRVTVTDLLARVCAAGLERHPDVNVQYTDEALLRFPTADIGIAVAAPQGLVVPVIRSAAQLSLAQIAARRGELVEQARSGALRIQDLEGGTFTISNLGMFGVEQFTAVLNPPQAAILAVGATTDRPVAVDGLLAVRPLMTVTLTVDHRAVDGAPAADFLRTVKTLMEEPGLAL